MADRKTLFNYCLNGGIVGRYFVSNFQSSEEKVYQVLGIREGDVRAPINIQLLNFHMEGRMSLEDHLEDIEATSEEIASAFKKAAESHEPYPIPRLCVMV